MIEPSNCLALLVPWVPETFHAQCKIRWPAVHTKASHRTREKTSGTQSILLVAYQTSELFNSRPDQHSAGLSLIAWVQGFPLATIRITPGLFKREKLGMKSIELPSCSIFRPTYSLRILRSLLTPSRYGVFSGKERGKVAVFPG